MKIRYLLLLCLLSKYIQAEREMERPVERQPQENKLIEEKEKAEKLARSGIPEKPTTHEPTQADREEKITEKTNTLYKGKGRSGFSSEADRIKKFQNKVKALSTEAQNIILELKKPHQIESSKLDSMIVDIDKTIAAESRLSSFKGETSKQFMDELNNTKIKLEQEKNRRTTQKAETKEITLNFENQKPDSKQEKDVSKEQKPEATVIEREENLLNNYSFDPQTKEISLKNDQKANKMINQLKSLLKERKAGNRTDLDNQIEQIRDALTTHFEGLRKVAIDAYGKNNVEEAWLTEQSGHFRKTFPSTKDQAKLNGITTKLSDLAKEQRKYSSLVSFFGDEIRSIQDNPSYPERKSIPDRVELVKQKLKLETKRKEITTKIVNATNGIAPLSEEDISRLKKQLESTRQEVKKIDDILNPKPSAEQTKDEPTNKPTKKEAVKPLVPTELESLQQQHRHIEARIKDIKEQITNEKAKLKTSNLGPTATREISTVIENLQAHLDRLTNSSRLLSGRIDSLKKSSEDNKNAMPPQEDNDQGDW